jgi:hypothetical protein
MPQQLTVFALQAHCDDLFLNLVVSGETQQSQMRVALPPGSVADYTAVCGYVY